MWGRGDGMYSIPSFFLGDKNMPQVIKISDTNDLVETKEYEYANWPFDKFNPVQSSLFKIFKQNSNVVIAAATSAGKTICGEIFLAYGIRQLKGKGIYVGPLKSLAKEKEEDWTNEDHHFSDLKTFIATGDFGFSKKRMNELDESSLIVMTPEMLASRCRNHKSEKSKFLYETNVIVFDESHLLTVPSRGDHIEVALMKLMEINPNIKLILLSATMPNVDEICGWLSKITNRDTYYLESDYRPCPLNVHYETYYDGDKNYEDKEIQKIGTSCAIAEYYAEDKFLIFVHTKRTGQLMVDSLLKYGIKSEFHNADLDAKNRFDLEKRFKNDKDFRVLVSTSTLAWGMNLPARRVIVAGVHRGLIEVENYDIQQMIGRAGRPKFDPRGDAYILVPESEKDRWISKLKNKSIIKSTLLDFVGDSNNPHYKTLAFHIVSEIHQGNVKTKEGFREWFKNSFAYYRNINFNEDIIDRTIFLLEQCGAIRKEEGEYRCTAVGKIASILYFSPFDVSDLRRNFNNVFKNDYEQNDHVVSLALGNIDSYRWSICNKQEKESIFQYKNQIDKFFGKDKMPDSVCKIGCAYHSMLKGRRDNPVLQSLFGSLSSDLDRTFQVLNYLDNMSCKWDKTQYFKILNMRIRYGVESHLVDLCRIPNIGAVRAKKLKLKNINNLEDFIKYDSKTLSKITGCSEKTTQESLLAAKEIHANDQIT